MTQAPLSSTQLSPISRINSQNITQNDKTLSTSEKKEDVDLERNIQDDIILNSEIGREIKKDVYFDTFEFDYIFMKDPKRYVNIDNRDLLTIDEYYDIYPEHKNVLLGIIDINRKKNIDNDKTFLAQYNLYVESISNDYIHKNAFLKEIGVNLKYTHYHFFDQYYNNAIAEYFGVKPDRIYTDVINSIVRAERNLFTRIKAFQDFDPNSLEEKIIGNRTINGISDEKLYKNYRKYVEDNIVKNSRLIHKTIGEQVYGNNLGNFVEHFMDCMCFDKAFYQLEYDYAYMMDRTLYRGVDKLVPDTTFDKKSLKDKIKYLGEDGISGNTIRFVKDNMMQNDILFVGTYNDVYELRRHQFDKITRNCSNQYLLYNAILKEFGSNMKFNPVRFVDEFISRTNIPNFQMSLKQLHLELTKAVIFTERDWLSQHGMISKLDSQGKSTIDPDSPLEKLIRNRKFVPENKKEFQLEEKSDSN